MKPRHFLALAGSLLFLLPATPAWAHTGFVSSNPADGATIESPITEITLTFSGAAEPAGEGFAIFDSSGTARAPDEAFSTDDRTWTLRFDEPLSAGVVGVRWRVAAPDAHPIEGSFSFTVSEPAPTTNTTQPMTNPEQTVAAPPSTGLSAPDPATPPDVGTEPIDPPAALTAAETPAPAGGGATGFDEFLDSSRAEAAGVSEVARFGSALTLIGVVVAVGGSIFARFVLAGDNDDIGAILRWVRRAGAVVALGALVEGLAHAANLASSWSGLISPAAIDEALWSTTGLALGFRLAGGALVTTGVKPRTRAAQSTPDRMVAARPLAAVGASSSPTAGLPREGAPAELRPRSGDNASNHSTSRAAFVGALLLVVSFSFDGHTVSEGPWVLHALANSVHVIAASAWAGGVAMLAVVLGRRRRRGDDPRSLPLAARFSIVATVALVAAGVAGLALTLVIVESVSQMWSTPWGRLLAAKVALVALAAGCGGYNHRILVPELERNMGDPDTSRRFRLVVTVEAALLVAVAAVTGLLAASSLL